MHRIILKLEFFVSSSGVAVLRVLSFSINSSVDCLAEALLR
jgi:hypothetical protein